MPLIAILGGHASGIIVAETVAAMEAAGEPAQLAGFLNDDAAPGETIGGIAVLGAFGDWPRLDAATSFIAAFPFPSQACERYARLRSLAIPEHRFATVRHPTAHVSPRARLGTGCYIGPGAVIEHGAAIGAHGIVRAGAYVSHDVRLGPFAFVGPNATLLGRATFGEGVHVGANAVCRDGITVGDYALIGIGAVVVRNVEAAAVVAAHRQR